jgi:hypothetical protein
MSLQAVDHPENIFAADTVACALDGVVGEAGVFRQLLVPVPELELVMVLAGAEVQLLKPTASANLRDTTMCVDWSANLATSSFKAILTNEYEPFVRPAPARVIFFATFI